MMTTQDIICYKNFDYIINLLKSFQDCSPHSWKFIVATALQIMFCYITKLFFLFFQVTGYRLVFWSSIFLWWTVENSLKVFKS